MRVGFARRVFGRVAKIYGSQIIDKKSTEGVTKCRVTDCTLAGRLAVGSDCRLTPPGSDFDD